MINVKKTLLGTAALAAVCAFSGSSARATIIVTDVGTPTFSGGAWTYTYDVRLTAATTITSTVNSGLATTPPGPVGHPSDGDFFALLDFPGYVAGSADVSGLLTAGGAGWSVTTPLVGLIPTTLVIAPDSPSIPNIDFQYLGSGVLAQQLSVTGGELDLGQVTVKSTVGPAGNANIYYSSQDFDSGANKDLSNQGFVRGPAVPEPASIALCGLMIGGLALRRSRRAR